MAETQTDEEVRFIETYQMWPCFPWLPIKRYDGSGSGPECAVIHASSLTTVIDQSLYGMTADSLDAAKRTEYGSVKELVADGWIVD